MGFMRLELTKQYLRPPNIAYSFISPPPSDPVIHSSLPDLSFSFETNPASPGYTRAASCTEPHFAASAIPDLKALLAEVVLTCAVMDFWCFPRAVPAHFSLLSLSSSQSYS